MRHRFLLVIAVISLLVVSMGCFGFGTDRAKYDLNYKRVINKYQPDNGIFGNTNTTNPIRISDKVDRISYIESIGKTKITFKSLPNGNPVYLSESLSTSPKSGNLMGRYKEGSAINFKLHVVTLDGTWYQTIKEWSA